MAELGQQTVDFSSLVGRAAEESYTSLKELVENSKSSEQPDSEKKIDLLKFLVKTQQRMLRLNVLAKWCQQCDGKFIARGAEGQEVLRVRTYGSSFFSLGINTRKGRFLLHSSRDILTASTLLECEDALNQGSMTATQVFSSLRSKSILHLFACTGRFIGLEVYENNFAAAKLPKNILNGPNVLLMGFPDCGSSYFLLMQLDKDLKLIFKLLEARSDPSAKIQSLAELNNVNRVKNIDVANIPMLESMASSISTDRQTWLGRLLLQSLHQIIHHLYMTLRSNFSPFRFSKESSNLKDVTCRLEPKILCSIPYFLLLKNLTLALPQVYHLLSPLKLPVL